MTLVQDVLILDHYRVSGDVLADVLKLRLQGATFRIVHSAKSAVQAAVARMPSVAIFDLALIGIGGEAAARLIRALPGAEKCSFVVLSGSVGRLGKLTGGSPFDHAFSKPADVQAIINLLKGLPSRQPVHDD